MRNSGNSTIDMDQGENMGVGGGKYTDKIVSTRCQKF